MGEHLQASRKGVKWGHTCKPAGKVFDGGTPTSKQARCYMGEHLQASRKGVKWGHTYKPAGKVLDGGTPTSKQARC